VKTTGAPHPAARGGNWRKCYTCVSEVRKGPPKPKKRKRNGSRNLPLAPASAIAVSVDGFFFIFKNFCTSRGIRQDFSIPYGPQDNAVKSRCRQRRNLSFKINTNLLSCGKNIADDLSVNPMHSLIEHRPNIFRLFILLKFNPTHIHTQPQL